MLLKPALLPAGNMLLKTTRSDVMAGHFRATGVDTIMPAALSIGSREAEGGGKLVQCRSSRGQVVMESSL
jgi:hypothetical protein